MSWHLVKLSDVAKVNPRLSKDVDEAQTVSFVAMASASEEGNLLSEENRILSETRKGFTYFEKGDVLLAKITPCFENGKCLRPNQISNQIGFGSTEFHVLRADPKKIDSLYLFYMVWGEKFRWLGERSMSGAAGQKRVSTDFLRSFEIPLPPLAEQKRIAAILDKADNLRSKRQQAIDLADEFLRAVFLELFGDPVTNPKGWDVKSLREITTKIGSGATPRGGKESYVDEGISLVRSLNIHDDKFVYKNLAHITDVQAEGLSNVILNKNDVLLNITGASVCRCTIIPDDILPARVNQHVCIIRSESVESEFLLHHLIDHTYKRKLLNLAGAGGATREALTKQQVESLEIMIPPENLQKKFLKIKNKVNDQLEKSLKQTRLPFFESLSQKAFKGEL